MPITTFSLPSDDRQFSLDHGDLTRLEIRDAGKGNGLHYFYDTFRRRLITDFVLDDRPQVALVCSVTLIEKSGGYSPRIRLWKKDKTKAGKAVQEDQIPDTTATRSIKASVDTDGGQDNFWKLINFLQTFKGVVVPPNPFAIVDGDSARLASLLRSQDKQVVLEAVRAAIGSNLSEKDVTLLANRKQQLERFDRLLNDSGYFEEEERRIGKGPENVWQTYFEGNQWIFGYGLKLVVVDALDDAKLERITIGASIFEGAGKRSDALMRSRGYISSLLFCEIKTHRTPLLAKAPYRAPDVFQVSKDLSGAVAQVQKTVRKVIRKMNGQIHRLYEADGSPTDIDISTTQPRQVVLIGSLEQFDSGQGTNAEKLETFELFRTSNSDMEVITFDELYQRARFIVRN